MDGRLLVVSFHDLHPGSMACCIRFLTRLEALGVPRACLLTVPNWYGREPLSDHPDFCAWLREQPHDISLHGFTHVAGHRAEKPLDWLIANRYTAGEGEFFRLPVPQAEALIRAGMELFRKAGVTPQGFVAPAWLMEDEHLPILREAGLGYAVTLNRLYDLRNNRTLQAPVLCCTARTRLRRALTRQVVSMLAAAHRHSPILRIAVHPVDFEHPMIEEFTYRLIAAALETRTPATYSELVAEDR